MSQEGLTTHRQLINREKNETDSDEDPGYATVLEISAEWESKVPPPIPPPPLINIDELYAKPKKPKQVCSIKPSELKTQNSERGRAINVENIESLIIMKKEFPVSKPPKLDVYTTTSVVTDVKTPANSRSPKDDSYSKTTSFLKNCAMPDLLQDEIEILQEKIDSLLQENRLLKWKMDDLVKQYSSHSNECYMKEKNEEIEMQLSQALQENVALKEQFLVFQKQVEELQEQEKKEVIEIMQQLKSTQTEKEILNQEYHSLKQEFTDLKQRYQLLLAKQRNSISREQHVMTVDEINRLFEDLKRNYNAEMNRVHNELRNTEKEKNQLKVEVKRLEDEVNKLQSEKNSLSVIHDETVNKNSSLSVQLEAAQKHQKELQQLVAFLAQLVEQGTNEREALMIKTEQQAKEQQTLLATMMERSLCIGKLQEKLKVFKAKTLDEFQKVESRLIEKDASKENMKQNYEREIKHLRHVMLEKQQQLDQLQDDKRKLEDLEILWQSTGTKNTVRSKAKHFER